MYRHYQYLCQCSSWVQVYSSAGRLCCISIPINPSASKESREKTAKHRDRASVSQILHRDTKTTDVITGKKWRETLHSIHLFHPIYLLLPHSLCLSLSLLSLFLSPYSLSLSHTDSPSVTAPSPSPLPPHELLMRLRHTHTQAPLLSNTLTRTYVTSLCATASDCYDHRGTFLFLSSQ